MQRKVMVHATGRCLEWPVSHLCSPGRLLLLLPLESSVGLELARLLRNLPRAIISSIDWLPRGTYSLEITTLAAAAAADCEVEQLDAAWLVARLVAFSLYSRTLATYGPNVTRLIRMPLPFAEGRTTGEERDLLTQPQVSGCAHTIGDAML